MSILNKIKSLGENSRIILWNTIGAFAIKGLSIVVSFVTVPIFIRYFSDIKILGIWYTLLSVLIWFLNFDLGLGNGIRNNLVKDITSGDYDSAKRTMSSGFFSVGVITIFILLLGIILINNINLGRIFRIDNNAISPEILRLSTLYIFIAVMLRFFLTTITSVFYALQKSSINNFLALCISVLQLLYILIFRFDDAETALLNISFAYIFISNLPVVIAGIILFCGDMRKCTPSIRYIDEKHLKAIVGIGSLFFLCQILYMVIANTNEFFITNLYGAEFTSEYTFYYKLTSVGTMVISLALTPMWSVVTKAQSEGNYVWLNKLYRYIKITGLFILVLQLMLIPFVPWVMKIWIGNDLINVSYSTAFAFALFSSIFLYSGMLSTIANGLAMMNTQTIMFSVAVILKFGLLLFFRKITSWDFVVYTNFIILLPYVISQQLVLNKYFKMKILSNS